MRSEIQVSSIAKHFRISASLSYFKRTRILSVGTVHITPPQPEKGAIYVRPIQGPHFGEALSFLSKMPNYGGCCLKRYYETGSKSGIQAKHTTRLRLQLAALDTSRVIDDMDVPGYRLHPLKGRVKNRWSIWVSGNWRLTFEFRDGNAYVLDYEDYH